MATNPLRRIRRTGRLTPEEVARDQAIRQQVLAEFPSLRMTRYSDLERKLVHVRWINVGCASPEEDALLEEKDRVWGQLTAEEREVIDREPPRSLIRTGPPERSNECLEVDVLGSPGKAPRVGKVA